MTDSREQLPGAVERRPIGLALERNRLLVVGSGSIGVVNLPAWLGLIKNWYPTVEVRVLLTYSATRFVSHDGIAAITHRPPYGPDWPAPDGTVAHQELASWPDAVVIMPATLNLIAKLAAGIADSFVLAVLHSTPCPVIVAPSIPAHATTSIIYHTNVDRLTAAGYRFVDTIVGPAASSGADAPGAMASLPSVLLAVAEAMSRQQEVRQP